MRSCRSMSWLYIFSGFLGSTVHADATDTWLMGGGHVKSPPGNCISPDQQSHIQKAIEEPIHRQESARKPLQPFGAETLQKYLLYPHAGFFGSGMLVSNFVDLDPSNSLLDFSCSERTYNGHLGVDTGINSFAEQDIGVPVFAPLDGIVIAAHDGEADRNTVWNGQPANFVFVDHGDSHISWYFHLRKNSISVSVGDLVKVGQQIGEVGSSGISSGPHLHFETRLGTRSVVEPFAGPCNSEESLWQNQPSLHDLTTIVDFTLTNQDLNEWQGYPFDTTRTGTFLIGDQVFFWLRIADLPADSDWRVRFIKPDGQEHFDSGNHGFEGGNNPQYGSSWWWWSWDVNLDEVGTWNVEHLVNDEVLIKAPFDVVPSAGEVANHPPNPIQIDMFSSLARTNEYLTCQLRNLSALDDLDYDVVHYQYEWAINGEISRDIASAARSDILQSGLVKSGDVVTCSVTPSDGATSAPTVTESIVIGGNIATAVAETHTEAPPEVLSLRQNYPNPFNSHTVIGFDLPTGGDVELVLYDLLGQSVATIVRGHSVAGTHKAQWDGLDDAGQPLASGVYLYRLQSALQTETRKLLLIR